MPQIKEFGESDKSIAMYLCILVTNYTVEQMADAYISTLEAYGWYQLYSLSKALN